MSAGGVDPALAHCRSENVWKLNAACGIKYDSNIDCMSWKQFPQPFQLRWPGKERLRHPPPPISDLPRGRLFRHALSASRDVRTSCIAACLHPYGDDGRRIRLERTFQRIIDVTFVGQGSYEVLMRAMRTDPADRPASVMPWML